MSDTHARVDVTAAAVQMLQQNGASYLIHCGDVGGTNVLDCLAGTPAAFVWGNCDFDRFTLERYARNLGIQCYGPFGHLTLEGKQIALLHGDDAKLRQQLLDEQAYDYLFQGHTHHQDEQRVGRTHLVNPGALFRANPKTVALLDVESDAVQFLTVAP